MRYIRLFLGSLILFAVIFQYVTFAQSGVLGGAEYFSYFTVLSSIFFAVTLLLPSNKYPLVRGATTLYILLTGIGFTVLLGGKNDGFLAWTNFILHYVAPIFAVIDWFLFQVKNVSFKQTFVWLLFPVIYFIYSLIRGRILSWYPYDFVNPNIVGSVGVATYAVAILMGSLLINYCLTLKRF